VAAYTLEQDWQAAVIGYPLLLRPQYDEKVWGGRRLETVLGKSLPLDAAIGESLETGDAAVVVNGPLAGRTLGELARAAGETLLGTRGALASQPFGDFPLLVKFIDAADVLSVQVHPDDQGALGLGKRGKTEAWYVVQAEPGAALITGLVDEVTADEVRAAIEVGGLDALLERRTVACGDTLIVPAGTVHAIAAGVLLYEIQENSDVTFRLYDWERLGLDGLPRDLHLEDALRALAPGRRATTPPALPLTGRRAVLAACRYFTLERWTVDGEFVVPGSGGGSFHLLSGVEGACELRGGKGDAVRLERGHTALLPADLPECRLVGRATVLDAWIADLATDVVAPLLSAGHQPEEIALLGGSTGDLQGPVASAQRARSSRRRRRGP